MDRFFFCRFLRFSKSIFRHLWNGFGPSFCFVISEVLSNSWRESAILSDAWDNWIGASGPRGNWMFPSHFKRLSISGRDSRGCLRYFQGFLGTKELFLEKKNLSIHQPSSRTSGNRFDAAEEFWRFMGMPGMLPGILWDIFVTIFLDT